MDETQLGGDGQAGGGCCGHRKGVHSRGGREAQQIGEPTIFARLASKRVLTYLLVGQDDAWLVLNSESKRSAPRQTWD